MAICSIILGVDTYLFGDGLFVIVCLLCIICLILIGHALGKIIFPKLSVNAKDEACVMH
jgi:hypothetical protein